MMSSSPKVKKSSVYLFGKVAEQISGLIITWLLITKLTMEEYGIYNFLISLSVYFGIFSSFGLVSAFHRYFPDFFKRKIDSPLFGIIKFGMFFRALTLSVIILITYMFFDEIGQFFQIENYFQHFLLFSIATVFLLQANFLERILETLFLHKYVAYANIVHTFIRFSCLIPIFYLDLGLLYVIRAEFIANLALLAIYYFYYKLNANLKIERSKRSRYFSKISSLKQYLSFSHLSFLNEVGAVLVHVSTDFIIIAHFLGVVALGKYAFVVQVSYLISKFLPIKLLKSLIIPIYFSRYIESADKLELDKMFHLISKITAFVLFPILTLMVVLGREFIGHVFDPRYLDSYYVMIILCIYYIILSFPVSLPLQMIEKTEVMLISKLALFYHLIMSILLVQAWGIVGVALSTTSAVLLKKVFEYSASKKYIQITFPWTDIFKIIFNSLVVGLLAYWAKPFVTSLVTLVITCLVIGLVYLWVSYRNMAFIREERKLINQFFGKPYFRLLAEN